MGKLWGPFFTCKAAGEGGGVTEGERGVASYLGASARSYALGIVADILDLA